MINYLPRVPYVPTCLRAFVLLLFTCFHFLRAQLAFIFSMLYVPSVFYAPYVPSFFYAPYVPSFFTCPTCLNFFACLTWLQFFTYELSLFLRVLRAFIFFTCFTCLHYFMCLHFLRAYILFMYMLIKLTQINENLSTFFKHFHFYKTPVGILHEFLVF